VRFGSEAERDRALGEMSGHFISNRPIRVSLATAKKSSSLQVWWPRCAHMPRKEMLIWAISLARISLGTGWLSAIVVGCSMAPGWAQAGVQQACTVLWGTWTRPTPRSSLEGSAQR
jgi:hypothetical protein